MANHYTLPKNYKPLLTTREIEQSIYSIKVFFQEKLAQKLNLTRVTAPLFVRAGTGINDDLNGVERPVRFQVKGDENAQVEMVQSLAKWKRMALAKYGFKPGEGLYTDMNAVRPDEILDNIHSIYVDQWDWEIVILEQDRHVDTLKDVVRAIYEVICQTEFYIASRYFTIRPILPQDIVFVTSDQLYERYPDLSPREREDRICAEHKAVFVMGIGADLQNGQPHDGRAPDYDDWTSPRPDGGKGLNGDILIWNPVINRSFELSSMGIRVNREGLVRQLRLRNLEHRKPLVFHSLLLDGKLPQTMGGGIGQSRLCMFLLRTAHVGEVAVGIWPSSMEEECKNANVFLL